MELRIRSTRLDGMVVAALVAAAMVLAGAAAADADTTQKRPKPFASSDTFKGKKW